MDKKELIFNAGKKLFEQYGYKKVSIDEITQKANVAKGTFYLYFSNKDDLYTQILLQYREYWDKHMKTLSTEETNLQIRLYKKFIWGLVFMSKNNIMKELLLDNPNYYSPTITKEVLMWANYTMMETLLWDDIKKLRKEISLDIFAQIHCFMLSMINLPNFGTKEFWNFADATIKSLTKGMMEKCECSDIKIDKILKEINKIFN